MRPYSSTLACSLAVLLTLVGIAQASDPRPLGSATAAILPSARCASAKQKVAVRRVAEVNNCLRKAGERGVPVDPACLDKAHLKFSRAFESIEASGRCSPMTGDAVAVAEVADDCAMQIAGVLPGMCLEAGSPCGSVSVSCCAGLVCQAEFGSAPTCR